ncbi:hypothetical protein PFISCL1PPCAC_12951, partial [Pristionchus fissidentatus]
HASQLADVCCANATRRVSDNGPVGARQLAQILRWPDIKGHDNFADDEEDLHSEYDEKDDLDDFEKRRPDALIVLDALLDGGRDD